MDGNKAYILSKNYANLIALGIGSMRVEGSTVYFTIAATGEEVGVTLPVPKDGTNGEDGVGIANVEAVANGLKFTYTDGTSKTVAIELGETKFTGKAGQAIGGIKLNETFTDVPLTEMWKKLLQAPYTKPSLTIGFSPTKTLYDKVEETVSEITISTNVTKNTNEIANVKFYVNDVVVHTISDDSVKNGGVFTYKHTFTTPTNSNFTVKASVTDKLVDGNGNQTITSGLGKINFVAGSYFGIVPDEDGTGYTPTEASIKALTKTVKSAKTYNDTISGTKARFVYAYPKELGTLTSILDTVNNFQYFTSTTQEEITVDGIAYYVYYLTNRVTFTDVTLKFS